KPRRQVLVPVPVKPAKPISLPAPVEVVTPSLPPPPPPEPPRKVPPRELVLWGGREFLAEYIDQFFYMISGPPGRGKTAVFRLFMQPIIREVLDPDCHSTLICFDPKREMYAWIASQMPQETDIPLRLLCPSDANTWTLDFAYDFFASADHDVFSLALAPLN